MHRVDTGGSPLARHRRSIRPNTQPSLRGTTPVPPGTFYQADVAPGLEAIARAELRRRLAPHLRIDTPAASSRQPGALRFDFAGAPSDLLTLQTVNAVYLGQTFPVPRPRALLGHQHLHALLWMIAVARQLHPPDAFRTLHLSAAGSESTILQRLKEELSQQTGLTIADDEGDLHLRLHRPLQGEPGWDLLVRLSPRPLATRPWRVCNREGALNAPVAHAMAQMSEPQPDDVYLNLACGSGSLLIERLAAGPARQLIGCDTNPDALACARANIAAAGYTHTIALHDWDARAVPLPDASIDALVSDLPFGSLVGTHADNLILYPAILREAARLAKPGAPFVLVTHEIRLMEALLTDMPAWGTDHITRITLRGLHPRIYQLRRR